MILGKPNEWFNPNAFLTEANNGGFYGNLGRDTLIGPGLATWDFSVHEADTHPRAIESAVSSGDLQHPGPRQFQHAEFDRGDIAARSTIPQANPAAGAVTSTSTTSRQVQFGLKLLW